MGKKETIPDQDTGESQKPASWFVSTPLASGSDLPTGTAFPTGTVTFLFTDIEGSTPHWEHHPKPMAESRAMSINVAIELALDGTVETPEIVEK